MNWIFLKLMFQNTLVWISEMFVLFCHFIFMIVFFAFIASVITFCVNIVWWIFYYSSWNLKMLKFESHFLIAFSFWLLSFYLNSFWYHFFRSEIFKNSFQKHEKYIFQILLIDFMYLDIETLRTHAVYVFFAFFE